jgi:hypothetical protein
MDFDFWEIDSNINPIGEEVKNLEISRERFFPFTEV